MTITKRNGKYYCRFQIDGERHHYLCSGATSMKEAEKMEAAFKYKVQQQQNGVIPKEENKKITLGKVLDNFLAYSELNKKTYTHDKGRVSIILSYWKETKAAEDICPNDIDKLKLFLLNEGKSKVTVNLYLDLLSAAFNRAILDNLISKNPFNRKYKFQKKNYSVRYLTKSMEKNLYKAAPSHFIPILDVALNTGLRRTNIIQLKWSNINLDFRIIELLENKGNKHIKLPINDKLMEVFNSLDKTSEYVFINPDTNKPYSQTVFTRLWNDIRTKAGLGDDFRFHDLRHTVGTRLAEKRVPVNIIKEVMAHTDISTTQRYIHFAENQLTSAMDVLNSYN